MGNMPLPPPPHPHVIIQCMMSDSSACMVTSLLPLTYTQTNHVSILHTSLYVAIGKLHCDLIYVFTIPLHT